MKKIAALLITVTMILGLAACGNSSNVEENANAKNTVTNDANSEKNQGTTENGTSAENVGSDSETTESNGRILVAYFSATGTTEGVAEKLANGLGADLYEITPAEPYTDADLDYNDKNSRSTKEMNDPAARPEIEGFVAGIDNYDTVFIGYPIWWGDAPKIVYTFIETYDFSDKTIVPFCTSASSGIGSSATNLEKFTTGATWLEGKRFGGNDSQETIMDWVSSLDINR